MGHLADLFLSRAWFRLQPDLDNDVLVTAGAASAAAARTAGGESILVYVPSARTLRVDLTNVAGSSAHAWWFSPQNGGVVDLGLFPTTGVHNFGGSAGPRLLVLDDASAALPARAVSGTCSPSPPLRLCSGPAS